VQLFRGDNRVFLERTRQPRLRIGPTWSYEGKKLSLSAGEYRWYVWPLTDAGARAGDPLVQARVVITGR
jgi:hypothetical protein